MEQIKPFKPTFTLGERVDYLEKQEDGSYVVTTSDKTQVHAQVIRDCGRLRLLRTKKAWFWIICETFEGKGVTYMVKNPLRLSEIRMWSWQAGGDSALDWTIYLAEGWLKRADACSPK